MTESLLFFIFTTDPNFNFKLFRFHTVSVLIGKLPSELCEWFSLAKIGNEKGADIRCVCFFVSGPKLKFYFFSVKRKTIKSVVRVILCVLEARY